MGCPGRLALVLGLALAGCGLNLDLDPPDQRGGMDGGRSDSGGLDAGPGCTSDEGCDDGDPCNGRETCALTGCTGGTPPVCDDMVACTVDQCEPGHGCKFEPDDTLCDLAPDGRCEPETGGCQYPTCDETTCVSMPCVPASCSGDTCEYSPRCVAGQICCDDTCYAEDCDDNPCTDDACIDGTGCVSTPNMHGCEDGNPCTEFDTCNDGVCIGQALDCDDDQTCTIDSCEPALGGCVHDPEGAAGDTCVDEDPCTGPGTCADGRCVAPVMDCPPDENPCTLDACDSSFGGCYAPDHEGLACADDDPCTFEEACAAGVCVGRPPPVGTSCAAGRTCSGLTCCAAGQYDCDRDGICECPRTCDVGSVICGTTTSCVVAGCLPTERCCPCDGLCHPSVMLAACSLCPDFCAGVDCASTAECCCDGSCRPLGTCPSGCGPVG